MNFTPEDFLRFLEERQRAIPAAQEAGLNATGERMEKAARDLLGEYQREETGPFAPWAELSDVTKERRTAAGFSENDPGLASGAMRESIKHRVDGHTVTIGTDDPHAVWFEDGSTRQPPRPFLSLALWKHGKEEAEHMARKVFGAVTGIARD